MLPGCFGAERGGGVLGAGVGGGLLWDGGHVCDARGALRVCPALGELTGSHTRQVEATAARAEAHHSALTQTR